ncbi:hypothetical protein M3Y94_00741600 [Aphelenchoides besseyi]|nr:hypothetical protein M3Y94_00741600 [Aphelenchoides besseyi]KAI6231987.1 hypothetical protein M3Y95_00439400 [Aphelenchoides besseyi]
MSDNTYNVIDEEATDELFKDIGSASNQLRSRSHSSPPLNQTRVLQFSSSTIEGKRAKKIVTFATPPRFNRSYEAESVNRSETLTLYRPTKYSLLPTESVEDPSVQINTYADEAEEESNFQLYETRPSFRFSDSSSPTNSLQEVSAKEPKFEINFSIDLHVNQTQASSETYVNEQVSEFGDRTHVITTPACNPQLVPYESESYSGSPNNATHVINSPIIKLTRNEQETLPECSAEENDVSTDFVPNETSTLTAHLFEQTAHTVVKKPLSTIDEVSPPDENSIPQTPIPSLKQEPNMTSDLVTPVRLLPSSSANQSALASLNQSLRSLTCRYRNSTLIQHNITETPVKWRDETTTLIQRCSPLNGPIKLRCIDTINWAQELLPPSMERKPSIYVPLPIDHRYDLNDPRSQDPDWLKAQRMVVRVINKFEGDMRLARDHIVQLHAKHVQKITPLHERLTRSLDQLRQLENKYEERWVFRNQLIEGIRKKKNEEMDKFIASMKSRTAAATVKLQADFPSKFD